MRNINFLFLIIFLTKLSLNEICTTATTLNLRNEPCGSTVIQTASQGDIFFQGDSADVIVTDECTFGEGTWKNLKKGNLNVWASSEYLETCAHGIDISSLGSVTEFECIKNDYLVTYVVIRCYRSLGSIDSNCVDSVRNARTAGIKYVDVYMYPDPPPNTKNGKEQVKELLDHLTNNNLDIDVVWLDIETAGWNSDYESHKTFYEELLEAIGENNNYNYGIYSNLNNW